MLLFANPPYVSKRADLTLRASLDEGRKPGHLKSAFFEGATAYSDLTPILDRYHWLVSCTNLDMLFHTKVLTFEKISLSQIGWIYEFLSKKTAL